MIVYPAIGLTVSMERSNMALWPDLCLKRNSGNLLQIISTFTSSFCELCLLIIPGCTSAMDYDPSFSHLLAFYDESDDDDGNILEFLLRLIFYIILIIVDHQCVFVATACLWCSRLEIWEKEAI